ncbi:MAG: hypothetical protein IPH31_27150 [Lewinellaceae bacterium]|nr:hypothetical protein [Lewinellaceae bacterium]
MKRSILIKDVLPFVIWYSLMILITIAIDYFLHYFRLVNVGLYLGYIGTFLIILSFVYSLRKRLYISTGSAKQYLRFHEYMAWAGSVMILVHAGIHFNAQLAWLAVVMLLINVASGLVGKFLLKTAGNSLSAARLALEEIGISKEETDKKLFFDAIMVNAMRKWREIHLPISLMFGILSLLHIITVFMFKK